MTKKSIAQWLVLLLTSTTLCLAFSTTRAEVQKKKGATPQEVKVPKVPKLQLLKHHKSEGDVDLVALNKSGSVAATYFGEDYGT